jgi:hypothetical protein
MDVERMSPESALVRWRTSRAPTSWRRLLVKAAILAFMAMCGAILLLSVLHLNPPPTSGSGGPCGPVCP